MRRAGVCSRVDAVMSVGGGGTTVEFLVVLGRVSPSGGVSVVLPPGHCEAGQKGPDVADGAGEERYRDQAPP